VTSDPRRTAERTRRGAAHGPLRAVLAALGLGAAYPGVWATVAPRSFYGDFPGAGRHWVDRLPAYNEHLVTDAGAFFLAFALLFGWAALRPARELVVPVCVAWSLFSALHLLWHVANLDGFPASDAIAQTVGLAAYLAGGLAAIALSRSRPARAAS
jgi:hypothetical protein